VISWFQAFAFKCNLYRYTLAYHLKALHNAGDCLKCGVEVGGLYKLNPVVMTHSLKAPGLNP
jgi:hypothetical protein